MRLKEGFILHSVGDEHMAVAPGEAGKGVNGIVRNNETAAYIFELLQEETTEDAIVAAMCERYEAEEERIRADVQKLLGKMREAGFLYE